MAYPEHEIYTNANVAQSALAVLADQSQLAGIVNREFSKNLIPGSGATVTVKRPAMVDPARVYTEGNRAAGDAITYSSIVEPWTSVKVTDQVYNAVPLNDFDATFTFTDLERQVVAPMAESVAAGINEILAAAFNSVPAGLTAADKAAKGKLVGTDGKAYDTISALKAAGTEFAAFGAKVSVKAGALTAGTNADVLPVIRAARQLFRQRGVPNQGRYLVVGSGWEAALMSQDILTTVNTAGDAGAQLRQAIIGNLYGFTVVADSALEPYAAFAFQKDGITLATALTAAPRGAAYSDTKSAQGFAVRYIHDYDVDHLTDRAVVDCFVGAQVLDAQRIVRLTGTEGFEEKTAPAGDGGEDAGNGDGGAEGN